MFANIKAEFINGNLIFSNKATGAAIFTMAADGTMTWAGNQNITGTLGLTGDLEVIGQFVKGSRFNISYPQVAAADVAKTFFIAPAACKVVSAYERHVTVAGQAGALQIEKLLSGQPPTAGVVVLASAFDLTRAAHMPIAIAAVATAAGTLAAGDALCLKLASGNAASYALGTITVTLEWL